MVLTAVGACGLPSDDDPREISSEALPPDLTNPPSPSTTSAPTNPDAYAFLVDTDASGQPFLVPQGVALPASPDPASRLRDLLEKGLLNADYPDLLNYARGPELELVAVQVDGDTAILDFTGLGGLGDNAEYAVAQIVYTATQFGITEVIFLNDGENTGVPLAEGLSQSGVGVTRNDFASIGASVESATTTTRVTPPSPTSGASSGSATTPSTVLAPTGTTAGG